MCQIDSTIARAVVKNFHYSKKAVNNSILHLGVFNKKSKKLEGVLQYGYPLNPKTTPQKYVNDSSMYDMLELNRMAMFDTAPKFSESQAIGLSIKYLKRYEPNIKWLLSFSDGKEGNVGTIYQATNWLYLGYQRSISFYRLDGEIIHSVSTWHRHGTRRVDALTAIYNNVSKIESRQYRYVFPLVSGIRFNFEKEPYPKKGEEPRITKETVYKKDGVILPKKQVINYLAGGELVNV